jgi:hypothetical protein
MGASSEMFLEMRANEIVQMYDSTFTKKEAIKTGVELAENVFESGEVSPEEVMANLSRLKWVIDSAESTIRNKLEIYDKRTVLGLEFNYVQGGNTANYSDDEVWQDLKSQLSHRESLLKVALNSKIDFYDEQGVQVPKVSTTPRKSSITIK